MIAAGITNMKTEAIKDGIVSPGHIICPTTGTQVVDDRLTTK